MAYPILLAPPAEGQLKALAEATQKRVVTSLKTLPHNPRPQGVKKLTGGDDLYRIIYTIQDKELVVLVVKSGDRKEVYR